MENKTDSSTAATANKKTLPTPLEYSYSWTEYQTDEELVAAKDEMTLEEQRKARNTQRLNNARQKALQKALDDAAKAFEAANGKDVPNPYLKPTLENDDQLRLKEMFKVLMSSKRYTEEAARELAAQSLGIAWATE